MLKKERSFEVLNADLVLRPFFNKYNGITAAVAITEIGIKSSLSISLKVEPKLTCDALCEHLGFESAVIPLRYNCYHTTTAFLVQCAVGRVISGT